MAQLSKIFENSTDSVCVWNHFSQEVCPLAIQYYPKLAGNDENPVQINELYLVVKLSLAEIDVCIVMGLIEMNYKPRISCVVNLT